MIAPLRSPGLDPGEQLHTPIREHVHGTRVRRVPLRQIPPFNDSLLPSMVTPELEVNDYVLVDIVFQALDGEFSCVCVCHVDSISPDTWDPDDISVMLTPYDNPYILEYCGHNIAGVGFEQSYSIGDGYALIIEIDHNLNPPPLPRPPRTYTRRTRIRKTKKKKKNKKRQLTTREEAILMDIDVAAMICTTTTGLKTRNRFYKRILN